MAGAAVTAGKRVRRGDSKKVGFTMKALIGLLLAGFLLISLSACSLRLPGIGIDIGNGGDGHDGHGSSHCPPGQAKKGRC